ncbi:MAG: secretin and TonB N-terminal domain-containing protein [Proteobacteria bacterium]|uniref:secretin and TonB N-terminal domain-containing protein n=1 Tax=Aquabacterium sp. TaxID=1872578 RepID=UPI0035C73C7C|nr:secretin and TonB N-terminal domain-containing protein [Pseudomonadota bacterium]
MSPFKLQRTRLLCASLALSLLLGACASPAAIEEAEMLSRGGQHESAVERLQGALKERPDDRTLRLALIREQDRAVAALSAQATAARDAGQTDEFKRAVSRMAQAAPQHPRTQALRAEVERLQRRVRLFKEAQAAVEAKTYERAEATLRDLLGEEPGNARARALLARVEEVRASQARSQATQTLAVGTKPVTLEFREAPLKSVFEALARAANLNFVFDKDVRGDTKTTVFLRNLSVDEALRVILSTQQLGYRLLNDNTVLVFPSTQQKQRDVLETVTKSYFLTNTDPKQAQTLVRTVAKTRDIFIDERLNLLVVRDTPEVVRLIDRLIQNLDVAEAEVVLELEVMEVSSSKVDEIGLSLPDVANYGLPGSATAISSVSGLRWSTANPAAIATLKSSRGLSNLLANPSIRARNREKAKVLLGEKLPVFTTTSTANVGVSASVNYLDVGLKLEVEPQVQLDNDVTIKVALEVSSVTKQVEGPQGSVAYQIGTRQASTTLRIRDGETQILAGLINDNETRNSAGVPGLHELPIAGRLFGTTKDTRDKTEVILLVTPRVVRNVVQPSLATAMSPSGTESQPGAMPMRLRDSASAVIPTAGSALGNAGGPRPMDSGRAAAAGAPVLGVTGPEEVMPGAAFQVMVSNPTAQPLNTTVTVDTSVVDITTAGGESGRIAVTVPPRGRKPLMLRAKPDVSFSETTVAMEGGEPLRLRVRNPALPDPADGDPNQVEPPSQPIIDSGGGNEFH